MALLIFASARKMCLTNKSWLAHRNQKLWTVESTRSLIRVGIIWYDFHDQETANEDANSWLLVDCHWFGGAFKSGATLAMPSGVGVNYWYWINGIDRASWMEV